MPTYVLREIPPELRAAFVAACRRRDRGQRAVLLELMQAYVDSVDAEDEVDQGIAARAAGEVE